MSTPVSPRYLIFDLDGTLVDSAAICTLVLNRMLEAKGSPRRIASAETAMYISMGGREMCAALLGKDCGDPDQEIAEFRRIYADLPTPESSIYRHVMHGLTEAKAMGASLAICSNKPQNLCEKVVSELGMDALFDVVVGGQPALAPKPAPDLLDRCLELLGADPENCLFIGDSELDHRVADSRAIDFVHIEHGYGACVDDLPVFFRATCFEALAPVMLDWCAQQPVTRA